MRACAEIDSQLYALIAELEGNARRTTITDYIALESRFDLASFELLTRFEQSPLIPFKAFANGTAPTWWTDYNAVKHRRLENLQNATLENAMSAVGGLYIVLLRQWGDHGPCHLSTGGKLLTALQCCFSPKITVVKSFLNCSASTESSSLITIFFSTAVSTSPKFPGSVHSDARPNKALELTPATSRFLPCLL